MPPTNSSAKNKFLRKLLRGNATDSPAKQQEEDLNDGTASEDQQPISPQLSVNREHLELLFANCQDIMLQDYRYGAEFQYEALTIYCDTLAEEKQVLFIKSAFKDLASLETEGAQGVQPDDVVRYFENKGVSSQHVQLLDLLNKAVQQVLSGNVLIFFDGWNKAISFNAYSLKTRQVSEQTKEPVVQGPHEATIEDLMTNLGLLRIRLRSPRFKIEKFTSGGELRTIVAFGYLEGAVNPETMKEFKNRIALAKDMEIMETSYIEELLEESTYSPFPQVRYTERPDTAVAALLDGKIIVLASGSPSILICPGLFPEFFTTSEDYYQRTLYSTLIRQMRIAAFFFALTLPSIYIAMSTFHSELIPTVLLMAILETREGIPFPALMEAILMEFFFELLREAGVRLPRPVGSAVSIVGALVIGQAAIQAKIASPIMVIIVSLTGIASFSLPQYNLATALRVLRFPLMILAGTLGGFGLMIGLLLIQLHLSSLRSLGQPYMAPIGPFRYSQLRDVFMRAPLKGLLRSPRNRHMHERPK